MTAMTDGVGITLLSLGSAVLLIRILRMWRQETAWNDAAWAGQFAFGISLAVGGLTSLITAVASPVECDNGCERSGVDAQSGLAIGAAVFIVISLLSTCCRCCGESDNTPRSGIDLTLIAMGLAVFVTDAALGTCPKSCRASA